MTPDMRSSFTALHDEAHADDKVAFALCVRQTCRDAREALDHYVCCSECGSFLGP